MVRPIQHVLLASDLSPASVFSYPHAVALAQSLSARLTLLTVDELADSPARDNPGAADYFERVDRIRAERLLQAVKTLQGLGADFEVLEEVGRAPAVIERLVDDGDVDLVVMTRGGARASSSLLGSTVRRVTRHVDVPVLVVHTPPPDHMPAEATPASLPTYARVMAGTDLTHDAAVGLQAARQLVGAMQAEMRVAYVWHHPDFHVPTTPDEKPPEVPPAVLERKQSHAEEELASWVSEHALAEFDFDVRPSEGPAEGLITAALEWDADLLAVPSHSKGALASLLLGSTTARLMKLSPLPVLVLPRKWCEGAVKE